MNLDFDYILLNLLLLLVFYYSGKKISEGNDYWKNAWICVLFFTLVQGLRYGRGHDYFHYCDIYNGIAEQSSVVFTSLNNVLREFRLSAYGAFLVYSFTYSLCAIILMKRFREYAIWMFPLFVALAMIFEEYMIRQALSYSFCYLFMCELFDMKLDSWRELFVSKKKVIMCILYASICISLHTANVLPISLFLGLYVFTSSPINFMISIPIYFLCVYVLPKLFDLSYLSPILMYLEEGDGLASVYAGNADKWFSDEARDAVYTRNPIVQSVEFVGVSSLLYLGYYNIKNFIVDTRAVSALFNSYFIGVSLVSLFRELEILNRIGLVFSMPLFMVLSVVMFYRYSSQKSRLRYLYVALIWYGYSFIRYLIMPATHYTDFIWDAPSYVSLFS